MSNNNKNNKSKLQSNNLVLNSKPFPFTSKQLDILNSIEDPSKHLTLLGVPGSGKTAIALYGALKELQQKNYQSILIVRSAVQSRNIGFLPGSSEDKAEVYEAPYKALVNQFYKRGDAYGIIKKKHLLEFELTSFLRGITWDNTIVIMDECQNTTAHELSTVITRLGKKSKLIVVGDIAQRDLTNSKELDVEKVLKVLESMSMFINYHMDVDDIKRSGLVKEFIIKQIQLYPEGF